MSAREFEQLGKEIDDLDFDTVFRIEDGEVIEVRDVYAPEVVHDPDTDVYVDSGWTCLTGMTGQYRYNGAVMHSSEYIGGGIAELLAEDYDPGTLFAVVIVNVLPDDCEEDHDHDGGCEPAGWAIAYRVLS